jgi:hypothetical protein
MNIRYLLYASALTVPVFLGGCLYGQCINGPCPLERQRIIKNIKPYGTRWIKENGTDEQRLLDIKECGGGIGLGVGFTDSQEEAERREGETSLFPARERLYRVWSQCMKDRGYRYVYQ